MTHVVARYLTKAQEHDEDLRKTVRKDACPGNAVDLLDAATPDNLVDLPFYLTELDHNGALRTSRKVK